MSHGTWDAIFYLVGAIVTLPIASAFLRGTTRFWQLPPWQIFGIALAWPPLLLGLAVGLILRPVLSRALQVIAYYRR